PRPPLRQIRAIRWEGRRRQGARGEPVAAAARRPDGRRRRHPPLHQIRPEGRQWCLRSTRSGREGSQRRQEGWQQQVAWLTGGGGDDLPSARSGGRGGNGGGGALPSAKSGEE
ncbi:Os11g0141800, partial [Oryza sativa Japonica Group]